jgi:hypothetical protein
MIDNTFATPYLCRPLEWGADIVVYSATKFIGGHGTSLGGVVVDSGEFNWSNGRFPVVADPSPAYHGLSFHETFGIYGYLTKLRAETLRDLGAAISPFNAFLLAQGTETLPLRMRQHVANAMAVAEYLDNHPAVGPVRYAGLQNNRYHMLANKYLPEGAGAVFCFELPGGREHGLHFIESLSLFSHLANVGDAKSLVIHPASTTHRQLNDNELEAAGIVLDYSTGPGGLGRTNAAAEKFMRLESIFEASKLTLLQCGWMAGQGLPNNLESSVCKAHAGSAVREITQGCIEILGTMGIARENLLEKWMRDSRITDIYEGTGEIQRLIIARGLLDYTRADLK